MTLEVVVEFRLRTAPAFGSSQTNTSVIIDLIKVPFGKLEELEETERTKRVKENKINKAETESKLSTRGVRWA